MLKLKETHPASYRGYIIANQLQNPTDNVIKDKKRQLPQRRTFGFMKITSLICGSGLGKC